jgi:5'-nucleotidase
MEDHGGGILSIDGTPADCVYVALHSGKRVLPRPPDIVVSGMNHGPNLGTDVFYSGTVAAAREGALRGVPAIAFSTCAGTNLDAAATLAARMALALVRVAPPGPVLLNVNFPAGSIWPARATCLGAREYSDTVEFREDPRGREYLWLGGPGAEHRDVPGSDTAAFDEGAVGVTPLVLDLFAGAQAKVAQSVAHDAAVSDLAAEAARREP